MPRPHIGSAALVVVSGAILLGQRAKDPNRGKWVLPGGKIEEFESIEAAAIREVYEETGLRVRIIKRLGIFEILEPPVHSVFVLSQAVPVEGVVVWGKSDLMNAKWVPAYDVFGMDLSRPVRLCLEEVLEWVE